MNGGEHPRHRLDGAYEWGVRKTVFYSVQWMLFVFEKGHFIINKQKMNR
jgi:hypothetical protein